MHELGVQSFGASKRSPGLGVGGRSEVKPKEERDPLFRPYLAEKLARDDDASSVARRRANQSGGARQRVERSLHDRNPGRTTV